MYHESTAKKEQRLAVGHDIAAFRTRIERLRAKWLEFSKIVGDNEEVQLISSLLFRKNVSPVNLAIVADNLSYFQNHCVSFSSNELKKALMYACLCGSESIGKYLLGKLDSNFKDGSYDFVLSYVAASDNTSWAEKLANAFKKANRKIPQETYLLCQDEGMLRAIEKPFSSTPKPPDPWQ